MTRAFRMPPPPMAGWLVALFDDGSSLRAMLVGSVNVVKSNGERLIGTSGPSRARHLC